MVAVLKACVVVVPLLAAACSSGGRGTSTTGTPVPTTETFSGSTRQTGVNSCTGDSHNITAQDGEISVRLESTSDPNRALSIQVCPGVDLGTNCTIAQQRINVGQTLSGTRRGGSAQNVKPLPFACVFGGTPSDTAVTYTIAVTYLK